MKQVDIRVIGKTEIDMNTLTEKAYIEVDKLFTEYSQLVDYKHYIWKHSKLQIDDRGNWYHTNDDKLGKVHNELAMIEYKIIDISRDKSNYKGWSLLFKSGKLLSKILDSKFFYILVASAWFYAYVKACNEQNIVSALCFGYQVWWWVSGLVKKIDFTEFERKHVGGKER